VGAHQHRDVSIEAGVTMGWERYTGTSGDQIGINHFGRSAPGPVVAKKFGMTADHVVERALKAVGK